MMQNRRSFYIIVITTQTQRNSRYYDIRRIQDNVGKILRCIIPQICVVHVKQNIPF
jgi:hypothetical protein